MEPVAPAQPAVPPPAQPLPMVPAPIAPAAQQPPPIENTYSGGGFFKQLNLVEIGLGIFSVCTIAFILRYFILKAKQSKQLFLTQQEVEDELTDIKEALYKSRIMKKTT